MNNFLSSGTLCPETRFIIAASQTVLVMALATILRKSLLKIATEKPSSKKYVTFIAHALYTLCISLAIMSSVKLTGIVTWRSSYWYPILLGLMMGFGIVIGEVLTFSRMKGKKR